MPTITLSGTDLDPDPLILTQNDTTVVVRPGAVFSGGPDSDFTIDGRSVIGTEVRVFGLIATGTNAWAMLDLFDVTGSSIVIGANGRVYGGDAMAIEASYDATIENAGEIRNDRGFGVQIIDPDGGRVTNDGDIFGEVGAVAFVSAYGGASAMLVNRGDISAGHGEDDQVGGSPSNEAVYSSAIHTVIFNSGRISSTDRSADAITVTDYRYSNIATAEITNSGVIRSTWLWGIDLSGLAADASVQNSGTIAGLAGSLRGSDGADSVVNSGLFSASVAMGSGNDLFLGTAGRVLGVINAGFGHDRVSAGVSNDTLLGGVGDDTLAGGAGTDRFEGGDGSDTVLYTVNTTPVTVDLSRGWASFPGQTWSDERLISIENAETGSGADLLIGNSAANTLDGGAGGDVLRSSAGADVLIGGAGRDFFRFLATTGSEPGAIDTLSGGGGVAAFEGPGADVGDRIDLSRIDANRATAADDAFNFGGPHTRGHLWLADVGGVTHVRGNVDGDAGAEFDLAIADGATGIGAYASADFVL